MGRKEGEGTHACFREIHEFITAWVPQKASGSLSIVQVPSITMPPGIWPPRLRQLSV